MNKPIGDGSYQLITSGSVSRSRDTKIVPVFLEFYYLVENGKLKPKHLFVIEQAGGDLLALNRKLHSKFQNLIIRDVKEACNLS
jgi:hypothetical protein